MPRHLLVVGGGDLYFHLNITHILLRKLTFLPIRVSIYFYSVQLA